MKRFALMFALFFAVLGAAACFAKDSQATLQQQAKITKEQAAKIALEKAPNGTIKESELEKEKGKLVWSFDIATPGTTDITEVLVDAKTGVVVAVEKETAAEQAKEQQKAPKPKKN